MYVACSTLSFARYPLEQALRIIDELEFSKLDVAIRENSTHLRPTQVVEDATVAGQRIRVGPGLTPAVFDVEIEAADSDEFQSQLKAICRLARMSMVSTITLPAAPTGTGIDVEVARLTALVRLCEEQGIVLTVPTRMGTLAELPNTAIELCKQVPGLGLTLDPSHFIAGPHQGKAFDEVYPYVRHVHLRDTGRSPDQFQVRIGQGEIEYGKIVSQLQRYRYDRLLTVAIQDVPDAPFVMESEVRKLKFLLESLI